MGELFQRVRQLVADERYLIGLHASERLEERGIMEWQIVWAWLRDSDVAKLITVHYFD